MVRFIRRIAASGSRSTRVMQREVRRLGEAVLPVRRRPMRRGTGREPLHHAVATLTVAACLRPLRQPHRARSGGGGGAGSWTSLAADSGGERAPSDLAVAKRRRRAPVARRASRRHARRGKGSPQGLAAATGEKGPRWYLGSDEVASRRPATDLPRRTATTPSSSVGPLSLRPAGTSPSIRRSHGSHFGRCRRRIASPPASSCHSPLCGPTTTGCGVTLSLHQDTRLSQTAVYGTDAVNDTVLRCSVFFAAYFTLHTLPQ